VDDDDLFDYTPPVAKITPSEEKKPNFKARTQTWPDLRKDPPVKAEKPKEVVEKLTLLPPRKPKAAPVEEEMPTLKPGKGGRREGSGQKPKEVRDAAGQDYLDYSAARAKNEMYKAKKGELDYLIQIGQYVSREHVQKTCATAYAKAAQAFRSIPDILERKLGVTPDLSLKIGEQIDAILKDLASAFARAEDDVKNEDNGDEEDNENDDD